MTKAVAIRLIDLHLFSLRNGAWEAIQKEAIFALWFVQVSRNQVHDQIITHEGAWLIKILAMATIK